MKRIHVFAGPSLKAEDRAEFAGHEGLDADLAWHGPIAHGELIALEPEPGDIVVIIDGVYHHQAPVRLKEIVNLLKSGVPVIGAASLGALRAAELYSLGMIGHGTVFDWYKSGQITSEAEVALTHGDAEVAYRPFTLALVTIRNAINYLLNHQDITQECAANILDISSRIHFTERSAQALLHASKGRDAHLGMEKVITAISDAAPGDVKRKDARSAVAFALSLDPFLYANALPYASTLPMTMYEARWLLDFQHIRPGGPTKRQLLTFLQLFQPDYEERHRLYVLKALAKQLAGPNSSIDPIALAEAAGLITSRNATRSPALLGLTTDHERCIYSFSELCARALIRSHRIAPGKLVYTTLPSELFSGLGEDRAIELCAKMIKLGNSWNVLHDAAGWGAEGLIAETFSGLWETPELWMTIIDRGFDSIHEFYRAARPFLPAALSMRKLQSTASSREGSA